MKKTDTQRYFTFISFVLIGLLFFGCAAKVPIWGNEEAGFNLQYRLDDGQKLDYQITTKSIQQYEIMNQKNTADDDVTITLTLVGSPADKPDQLTGQVTVDDMKMKTIQSAMGESGEIERDLSKVIGKSFELVFTPQGKETDYPGIENLTIDMGPTAGGEQSIRNRFTNILPDLSNNPVKIGEPWTSVFDETTPAMGGTSSVKINTTSKIDGYDTVNGYECVKISSQSTGTLDVSAEMMSMPYTIDGDITGESTWYFAYKKGLLVKSSDKSSIKSKLSVGGEQGISGPLDINGSNDVILTTPAS